MENTKARYMYIQRESRGTERDRERGERETDGDIGNSE